jgi:hypothetical protein
VYTCPSEIVPREQLPEVGGWFFSYTMHALLAGAKLERLAGAHYPKDGYDRTEHRQNMRTFDGVPLIVESVIDRSKEQKYTGHNDDRWLAGMCFTDRHGKARGRNGSAAIGYVDGHAGKVTTPSITSEQKKVTSDWENKYLHADALCVRTASGKWVTGRTVNSNFSTYGLMNVAVASNVGSMKFGHRQPDGTEKMVDLKWTPVEH